MKVRAMAAAVATFASIPVTAVSGEVEVQPQSLLSGCL